MSSGLETKSTTRVQTSGSDPGASPSVIGGTPRKIRYLVSGWGPQWRRYLRDAIRAVPGFQPVAIFDPTISDPDAAVREEGVPVEHVYTSREYASPEGFRRLLRKVDFDLLICVGPHHTHADQALAAIEAGKDVLTEKPGDTILDKVKAVRDAARAAGAVYTVAYQYDRWVDAVAKLLDAGKIGEVTGARTWWICKKVWETWPFSEAFWSDPLTGGVEFDRGGHMFSVLRRVVPGELVSVTAKASNDAGRAWQGDRFKVNDTNTSRFEFSTGAVGTVHVTWADDGPFGPVPEEFGMTVYGTLGQVDVFFPAGRTDVEALDARIRIMGRPSEPGPVLPDVLGARTRVAEDLYNACVARRDAHLDGDGVVEIEAAVHAMRAAADSGEEVRINTA